MERQPVRHLAAAPPGLAVEILRNVVERLRITENAVIAELRASNRELVAAYRELQAAQARLIEQERIEYELRTARAGPGTHAAQALPRVEGWTLTTCWHPARTVGGDFYDCFAVDDDHIALIIGDVTGKGIPAALVMATTCSLVRFVGEQLQTPGAMLARINDRVAADIPEKMFVTCLIAILEPATGRVRFANAGHNLPLVRGASGVRTLHARGMPLGLMPRMEYEEHEDVIAAGELLMLYSDGIVKGATSAASCLATAASLPLSPPCRHNRTCLTQSATRSGSLLAKGCSRRTISQCLCSNAAPKGRTMIYS